MLLEGILKTHTKTIINQILHFFSILFELFFKLNLSSKLTFTLSSYITEVLPSDPRVFTYQLTISLHQIVYQRVYHRCVYEQSESYEGILFLIGPLLFIIIIYTFLLGVIIKNKIKVTKVIVTTTAIVLTGVMIVIPEILMATFYLQMSYEAAQIFTVTLYYMGSVFNPLIYFVANPRVSEQMSVSKVVRKLSISISVTENLGRVFKRTVSKNVIKPAQDELENEAEEDVQAELVNEGGDSENVQWAQRISPGKNVGNSDV